MNVIQQATQSIQTPWQLIIALLTLFSLAGFYFFKRSEKKQDEMSKRLEEESKYHRERAEKKDDKIEKLTSEFTELVRKDLYDVKCSIKILTEKIDRRG